MTKSDACGRVKNSWYGSNSGTGSGSIKTKLWKCGRARLYFGNCCSTTGRSQYVLAKLNGREIGRVGPKGKLKVEFNFKNGDLLELTDIDYGYIEFNDFTIIRCSAC